MASPFPHTLEDPTDFVNLGDPGTSTCSPLVDMEASVDSNPQLIPTPPPESDPGSTPKHHSPTATIPSSSPHHSTSTNNSANEYIKGSSLEESPISSPSSFGEGLSVHNVIVNNQNKSKTSTGTQVKEGNNRLMEAEHDQHGSSISEQAAIGRLGSESSDDEDKDESRCSAEPLEMDGGEGDGDEQSSAGSPQAQNIPKNVKLPQSKLLT